MERWIKQGEEQEGIIVKYCSSEVFEAEKCNLTELITKSIVNCWLTNLHKPEGQEQYGFVNFGYYQIIALEIKGFLINIIQSHDTKSCLCCGLNLSLV
mgnify:CR=1 FL=1